MEQISRQLASWQLDTASNELNNITVSQKTSTIIIINNKFEIILTAPSHKLKITIHLHYVSFEQCTCFGALTFQRVDNVLIDM